MIQRNSFSISPSKTDEFKTFTKQNAKDQNFWNHIKENASRTVDKKELDKLFKS